MARVNEMPNEKGKDTLGRVKSWFEAAVNSKAYTSWRAEAKTSWDFYDGSQWTAEEVQRLAENGQPAIVINKIAPKIDNLAGSEVAGRTRIVYRSRSGMADEELAARVLTDLALYVAERSDQALEISNVFRAGLVGGIGWLDIGVEDSAEGVEVFAHAEDEFAVVWDPLSRRPDMSDARFVARERWLSLEEAQTLFADKAGALKSLQSEAGGQRGTVPYALAYGARGEEVGYYDPQRQMYRVVEVQYREGAKQWRVRLPDGRLVATFDKAKLRVKGAVVEETVHVPQVRVAYFSGDILLDDRPLAYEHNNFTLVPFVYKRQRADGRPYVTRSLPLTAEQQAERDQLNAIMSESLAEIKKLSSNEYAADADTVRVLGQWEQAQTKLLGKQVTERTRTEEETLARRGLSDSTAAQDVRRQRLLDQQDAEQNVSLMKDEMASQVRSEKLALQQNLYNIAATATDSKAARTAQAAANAQSNVLALNAQRQASLLDYYKSGSGGSSAFGNSFGNSLGATLGKAAAGAALGGPAGMLGSLFLRG